MNIRSKFQKYSIIFIALLGLFYVLLGSFWTEWDEYPFNPVLDPTSGVRAYYPTVLYNSSGFNGHGTGANYKMWFASPDSGVGGIAYAYSSNGINWTEYNNSLPLVNLNTGANHPVVLYDSGGFGGGGFYYKIWYWNPTVSYASIEAMRYAESVDGITWQNDQLLQQHTTDQTLQLVDGVSGSYFFHIYGPGSVIYNPTAANVGSGTPDDKSDDIPMSYRYVMYYDSSSEGSIPADGYEQTSVAYSTDGVYWIRYGDQPVVLPSGTVSDWDGFYTYRASVQVINGSYHMWYAGANGDNSIGTYYAHGIGHATSPDGLNWTKDTDNPALHVTDGVAWRDVRSYAPSVVYNGNRFNGHGEACLYKMWFTGRTGSNYTIGYAALCPPADNEPIAVYNCISQLNVGSTHCFDGSSSSDPDGDPITQFEWQIIQSPPGSGAGLSAPSNPNTCITPDVPGQYTIQLQVASLTSYGETVWSAARECQFRVTLGDQDPVAIIKDPVSTARAGDLIQLDGSPSYDPDGDPIVEYSWRISRKPDGSIANMVSSTGTAGVFSPDIEGEYIICLQVASENPQGRVRESDMTCITITIQGYSYCLCPQTVLTVERLEDRMWHSVFKIARLKWETISNFPSCDLSRYKIERLEEDRWILVTELDSTVTTYDDRGVSGWYQYRIVPLLADGRECYDRIDIP